MSDQNIDIVIRARELTQQAFNSVSKSLKLLEEQAQGSGKRTSQSLAGALKDIETRYSQAGQRLSTVGATLTAGITLPIVAAVAGAAKAAIDYESAFAGVRKTVDATEAELKSLSEEILDMSRRMPASAVDIAKVAESAGQLGIKKHSIADFAETMVMLGETTNLTADQAATSMARFANIMQTPQSAIRNTASALVALGNDGASTEAEIVDMALRIAGAGKTMNMTEGDVLGLANALSSVGIEAEMGGSAISKVMINIAAAANSGGPALESYAKVAGMLPEAFQKMVKADPGQALQRFIGGLGRVKQEGGDLLGVLEKLDITEVRMRDTMLRVANAGTLVADGMRLGNEAFRANTALATEYEKRQQTTAAQLKVLWNQIHAVGIELGSALLPTIVDIIGVLRPLASGVADVAGTLRELHPWALNAAVGLALVVAAGPPLIFMAGTLIQAVGAIAGALALVAPAGATAAVGATTASIAFAGLKVVALGTAAVLGKIAAAAALAYGAFKIGDELVRLQSGMGVVDVAAQNLAQALYGVSAADYAASAAAREHADSRRQLAEEWRKSGIKGQRTTDIELGDSNVEGVEKQIADVQARIQSAMRRGTPVSEIAKHLEGELRGAVEAARVFKVAIPAEVQAAIAALPKLKPNDLPGMGKDDDGREAADPVSRAKKQMAELVIALEAAKRSGAPLGTVFQEYGSALDDVVNKQTIFRKELGALPPVVQEFAKAKLDEEIRKINQALGQSTGSTVATLGQMTDALEGHTQRRTESILRHFDTEREAQRESVELARTAEVQKAEHAVALAQRTGASVNQVRALERQLGVQKVDAAIADAQREFQEKAALLDLTTEDGRRAYAELERTHQAAVSQMVEDWKEGEREKSASTATWATTTRDLLASIPNIVVQSFTGGGGASGALRGVLSATGASYLGHLGKTLSDGLGKTMGALVSGAFGALGSLIGPALTKLSGVITGGPEWKKFQKDVGRDLGVKISDAVAQAIEEDSKRVGRQAAMILNLDKIISEAGGVKPETLAKFTKSLRDAFSMRELGKISTDELTSVVDKNFQALVDVAKKKGGLITAELREIMALNDQFGSQSAAIAEHIKSSLTSGIGHLTDFLTASAGLTKEKRQEIVDEMAAIDRERAAFMGKDLSADDRKKADELDKRWDALKKQLSTADQLQKSLQITNAASGSAFAAAIAGSFQKLLGAGVDPGEAIKQVEPAVTALQGQLDRLGIDGGAAFQDLRAQIAMTKDEVAGPSVSAMRSLGMAIADLYNGGVLTSDMFAGLAGQVGQTFQSLVAQGHDGRTAMSLLKPQLQQMWELQKRFGTELDESTQKMLDEAEAAGLVGEAHQSAQERTVDGINKVVDRLDALLEGMGIKLPDAIGQAANAVAAKAGLIKGEIDGIVNRIPKKIGVEVDITGRYTGPDISHTLPVDFEVQGAAAGVFTSRPTLRVFGEGGEPELGGPVDFMTKALVGALGQVGALGGGGGTTVVPFAVFHTDERGRMPMSDINRHLASEAGITSNDFGLRELQDEMIDKRIALWMSRRG